jgi:hypothetical protein
VPSEPKAAARALSAHCAGPIREGLTSGRKSTHTEVGASLPRFSIHPSAWKEISANFALTEFSEVRYSLATPKQHQR